MNGLILFLCGVFTITSTHIFSISESIEMIWERPETRQIVFIGDILIDGDDIENFSVDRTESGSILIIARVHKSHEGQYKCRVATLQPIEVIHTMIVKPSQPLQQPHLIKKEERKYYC